MRRGRCILGIILIVVLAGRGGGAESPEKTGKKPAPGREKHYEDIEYHVLNDWQNIWFHPENIDMNLYADLRNHFPELFSSIEEWKKAVNNRHELGLEMGGELSRIHPDVETMPYIYMLAYEEPHLCVSFEETHASQYKNSNRKSRITIETCFYHKAGGHGIGSDTTSFNPTRKSPCR